MAINRFNADEIDKDIWDSILNLIIFDRKTLEFSFNQKELDLRRWFFCAIDDANFNIDSDDSNNEVVKLISLTKEIKTFFCLSLDFLKENRNISSKDDFYIFENKLTDWLDILSSENEFTLWETLIFHPYGMGLFIIKPWSVGYNLLIAGKPHIIENFSTASNWLLNKKYPICPA